MKSPGEIWTATMELKTIVDDLADKTSKIPSDLASASEFAQQISDYRLMLTYKAAAKHLAKIGLMVSSHEDPTPEIQKLEEMQNEWPSLDPAYSLPGKAASIALAKIHSR